MKFLVALAIMALCNSETYYSYKEYQDAYNLLDTKFASHHSQIINQEDLLIHLNAFGTIHYPKMIDNISLADDNYNEYTNKSINDPIYFSISFDQEIIVDEMVFAIEGYSNNKSLNKSVYINQNIKNNNGITEFSGGSLVYRGNNQNAVKLQNVGKLKNIVIRFEDLKTNDIVKLKYFKINKYQIMKHSKWVKDKIDNTDTMIVENCIETNQFSPNGTNQYVYDAIANFNAASKVLNKYTPQVTSSSGQTDYLRGSTRYPYSPPNLFNLDSFSNQIVGFKTNGLSNTPSMYFTSFASDSSYIKTGPFTGVVYQAYPIYWTQTKGLNNYIHTSYDSEWCKHTTDDFKTPCFKYQGHSNTQRLNSYDITVLHYNNIVKDNDVTFKDVNYYLYDVKTNTRKKLNYSNKLNATFHLNQTGIYKLQAEINDLLGNQITVTSNNFYIDQIAPNIKFNPQSMDWTNKPISVNINIEDNDSGVKSYVNKLNDQIIDSKVIKIDQEGIHQISSVAYDNVLNSNKHISGYYKLDMTKPIIESSEQKYKNTLEMQLDIYDELSGISYQEYQIYINDVLTESKRFDSNKLVFDIKDKTTIKIIAYDKAGNYNEYQKTYYEAILIDHLAMFTRSYVVNEENILYLNLKNNQAITVDITLSNNDNIIYQDKLAFKDQKIIEVPYQSDDINSTFKLQVADMPIINMDVSSINYMTNDDLIFEGVVAYYVDQMQNIEYLETLILHENYLTENLYQGYGIDISYDIEYFNQCALFEEFICYPSNDLNNYDIKFISDSGANDEYLINNQYMVLMSNINNTIRLPNNYLDLKTGKVSSIKHANYIDGYYRFYTNRNIDKGLYYFDVKGLNIAHNQFNFNKRYNYQITKLLKELYYPRFIDPNNINLKENSIHDANVIEQLR